VVRPPAGADAAAAARDPLPDPVPEALLHPNAPAQAAARRGVGAAVAAAERPARPSVTGAVGEEAALAAVAAGPAGRDLATDAGSAGRVRSPGAVRVTGHVVAPVGRGAARRSRGGLWA